MLRLESIECVGIAIRGGMGAVYPARNIETGAPLAIKFIHQDLLHLSWARRAFLSEIEIVSQLRHPGLLHSLGSGMTGPSGWEIPRGKIGSGVPWLATNWVPGGSLSCNIKPLDWKTLREVLVQTLQSLASCHALGFIHGDVKPNNILFYREQNGEVKTVLIDFGISCPIGWSWEGEGRSPGTPAYMSPDQLEGNPLDPTTDLYGLACTAWGLSTGGPPFGWKDIRRPAGTGAASGDPSRRTPPSYQPLYPMPAGFDAWLNRLLADHRAKRYPDARAALEGLLALPAGQTVGVMKVPFGRTSPRLHLANAGAGTESGRPVSLPSWVHSHLQIAQTTLPDSPRFSAEATTQVINDISAGPWTEIGFQCQDPAVGSPSNAWRADEPKTAA